MSKFLFQGDFVRKPNQTLGGKSRGTEGREALLQRAEQERKRRERERQEAAALLKLQGFFRSCLERKRMRRGLVAEFDREAKEDVSDEGLFRQIHRLNHFFHPANANHVKRLLDLGRILLKKVDVVTAAMRKDPTVAHAMKKVIRHCFRCLNLPDAKVAVPLRVIETYTDISKYTGVEGEDAVKLITAIWLYLVIQADLFQQYRQFLECKIPPMRNESEVNRITESYDYLMIYKRALKLKSLAKGKEFKIDVGRQMFTVAGAIELIMTKFAESFYENVIPLEGSNGVAAYYILPRLCEFIPWEEWVKTVPLSSMGKSEEGGGMRNMFYVTLVFMRNMELREDSVATLVRALCELRPSIDPRLVASQFTLGLSRELREIDDDMEIDEDEDSQEPSAKQQTSICLLECQMIYALLKSVLNKQEVADWLCPFRVERWKQICDIISCVVRLEPQMSSLDFRFLSVMSYKRDFMKGLCNHIICSENLSSDELIAFSWFFSHLLGTLHDAEFLSGLPIHKEDLSRLIEMLRDFYAERVLKDPVDSGGNSPVINAVTGVLMRLHDRNSRIHLFSEGCFISPMLSKVCPVETHSFLFEHLTSEKNRNDLSPMEEKLLKVLKDYPFALSFHDRVKVWNRLLDLDRQSNSDPYSALARQDIQIRRNYIYEDAFEKLSPENVPDLRKQIRISLVNVVGVLEAGIDGGGLLREFLTEATKAAVDPNRGLFRNDSQNRMYPNPIAKKLMPDFHKHFFAVGRLVGKALYEQTLLELPFAAFFIQQCIDGKVLSAVDFLATLDPDLHKNLLTLKTYRDDFNGLGLDFTLAFEELGETRFIELKRNGKDIAVDAQNVIEYIHLVADYKINREMEPEIRSFRAGLLDVVPTLKMFSWKELQTLISGSDRPIDIEDWRANTNYGDTYADNHPTIEVFWEVVRSFDQNSLRKMLKFVTSCSRPPLLGFKDLIPKFGIHSAGKTDRLPTASTCMNLLKLPEFNDFDTMREKLLFVINAHAGFELS